MNKPPFCQETVDFSVLKNKLSCQKTILFYNIFGGEQVGMRLPPPLVICKVRFVSTSYLVMLTDDRFLGGDAKERYMQKFSDS